MELFPEGNIHHLTSSLLDHCPLLISTTNENSFRVAPSFKFEAWWITEELIDEEIKKACESSNGSIFEKIERLQISLSKWAKSIKKKRKGLTKKLSKELEDLMEKDRDDDILAQIIDTRIHLNIEIDKEEVYWEQGARANWLKLRDKNKTFFHKYASMWRRINTISRLDTADGNGTCEDSEINKIATKYFQNLFSTNGVGDMSHILIGNYWKVY